MFAAYLAQVGMVLEIKVEKSDCAELGREELDRFDRAESLSDLLRNERFSLKGGD